MFKIAKLEKVDNEKIAIDYVTRRICSFEEGKKVKDETFKTLSFYVSGTNYSFKFGLKCKLEKMLEIPMNKTINFKDYIFEGGTELTITDLNEYEEPEINIKITRYLKNRFIVFLTFYTDYYSNDENNYSGMIEFSFNLDDYLDNN